MRHSRARGGWVDGSVVYYNNALIYRSAFYCVDIRVSYVAFYMAI